MERLIQLFTVLDNLTFQLGQALVDVVVHRVAHHFTTQVRAVIIDGNFHLCLSAEIRQYYFARSVGVRKILVQTASLCREDLFQSVCHSVIFCYDFKFHKGTSNLMY